MEEKTWLKLVLYEGRQRDYIPQNDETILKWVKKFTQGFKNEKNS